MTHNPTHHNLESLLEIMRRLRAPGGCPWDAEQSPESLTAYIQEEACELIDAIEEGSPEIIKDELGDLLLQVVFLAQIYAERQLFDFHQVAAAIAEKLVRRHPHVFEPTKPKVEVSALDKQWDKIKRTEETYRKACFADHLPKTLPALQRAQKLVSRACRSDRQAELPANYAGLKLAASDNEQPNYPALDEEALGQILFSLVRSAHDAGLDAEASLRKMTNMIAASLDTNQ